MIMKILCYRLLPMKVFQKELCHPYRLLSYSPYKLFSTRLIPAGIHLLKVNKGNTRTMREICSKLRIKASEQLQ